MAPDTTACQHSIGNLNQYSKKRKGNKRYTDWAGRNKTVFVCRSHDCLSRKSKSIDKNKTTSGMNKQL